MRTHTFRKVAARTAAAAVVAGGLIFGFSGLPATAAPPPAGTYSVLGDSYSAGSGGDFVGRPCVQSPYGYGNVFATNNGLSMTNLACYGATIDQVLTQVPSIPTSTRLVTLTVGGNDVGSGQVAAVCLTQPLDACLGAVASAQAKLALLPAQIKGLTKSIRAMVPRAQVVYMGYPHLFEVGNLAMAGATPQQIGAATAVNAAVDQLNAVLAQSVQVSGANFVSVTALFDGHGYPSADSWLISPYVSGFLAFHPTAAGYANGYAAALQNTKLSPPLYAGVWR